VTADKAAAAVPAEEDDDDGDADSREAANIFFCASDIVFGEKRIRSTAGLSTFT
jgi:hypothetical protein